MLAIVIATSCAVAHATGAKGTDIEAGPRLSMSDCLAMQKAKHDGASRQEMRQACSWTSDPSNGDKTMRRGTPHPIAPYPYVVLPDSVTPPPPST